MGKSSGLISGFDALVEVIEKISGQKFEPNKDDAFDLRKMRDEEAHIVANEIAKQKQANLPKLIAEYVKDGNIDAKWNFEGITCDEYNERAIGLAKNFVKECDKKDIKNPKLLIISGADGAGKTVICNAIANLYIKSYQKRTEIISFNDLRKIFLFSSNESREERQEREACYERYKQATLLIIDDLCQNREGLSSYDQKIFAQFLRDRHKNGCHTVLATIANAKDFMQAFGLICLESIKEYEVHYAQLYGASRRQRLVLDGIVVG